MPEAETQPWPQTGHERITPPTPAEVVAAAPQEDLELALLARLNPKAVLMMGDNPALPLMPERPTLADFFACRFTPLTRRHLLVSAARARAAGEDETVVLACLLHDIANAALIRCDHGYWGAQLLAPYVAPEVAWAIQYHQALRYVPDEAAGYAYPDSYRRFFGADYVPPAYLLRDAEMARAHPQYRMARAVTLYDTYFFDDFRTVDLAEFDDILARHFRAPPEGLGFDGSPSAHMWRTIIWPDNFL